MTNAATTVVVALKDPDGWSGLLPIELLGVPRVGETIVLSGQGAGVHEVRVVVTDVSWRISLPPVCECSLRVPPDMPRDKHFAWMRAAGFDLLR